ncbi:DNA-binding helix-turn-helix protein [Clostridium sporogenes ATCC 15579]|nr:DNA-binding helix-turn-helix protein [Clostridium sporogenes ATCC 15579]
MLLIALIITISCIDIIITTGYNTDSDNNIFEVIILLGDKIKKLRKSKNITQEELGKNIGVTTSMVGMYETNARKPSYEVLIKIADFFCVSTDFLLNTEEKLDMALDSAKKIHDMVKKGLQESDCNYRFNNAEEAMKFILKQPSIMGYGGFDASKMSDDEIVEFANELLNLLKMLGPKYNK